MIGPQWHRGVDKFSSYGLPRRHGRALTCTIHGDRKYMAIRRINCGTPVSILPRRWGFKAHRRVGRLAALRTSSCLGIRRCPRHCIDDLLSIVLDVSAPSRAKIIRQIRFAVFLFFLQRPSFVVSMGPYLPRTPLWNYVRLRRFSSGAMTHKISLPG